MNAVLCLLSFLRLRPCANLWQAMPLHGCTLSCTLLFVFFLFVSLAKGRCLVFLGVGGGGVVIYILAESPRLQGNLFEGGGYIECLMFILLC